MERSMVDVAPADVRAFAALLVHSLARWDPLDATMTQSPPKQAFIDALTAISALAADALAMEIRRLVVDADGDHLANLVAGLQHRDVLLKCKVANAVGSLCTSRVAGQRLLERHGDAVVASVGRMATSKNTWAQADAFFVFGWIAVIGDDAIVAEHVARFIPTGIKHLARNLQEKGGDGDLDEQDANLRIYVLVFLLNFSQRDVAALEPHLVPLLETLQRLVVRLVDATTELLDSQNEEYIGERVSEHVEFVRLTVTLLNAVVDQLDAAPATVIALKMLPPLLKLEQTLYREDLDAKLRGDADESEAEDATELSDLRERMRSIKETVLAHR